MMKNRSPGMIVVAVGVALLSVATALITAHFESKKSTSATVIEAIQGHTVTESDWEKALADAGVAYGTGDATSTYRAPSSLPPTEALAREIFADYAASRQGGKLDMTKANSAIADTVAHSGTAASSVKLYALGELTMNDTGSIATYEDALVHALSSASVVSEYELTTFSRAMKGSADDTARLKNAATVYADIVAKLSTIPVSTSLASDHLAMMNSLSALSGATKDLAQWNGDPLVALAIVNNFVKADASFSATLGTLISHMKTLEKKS